MPGFDDEIDAALSGSGRTADDGFDSEINSALTPNGGGSPDPKQVQELAAQMSPEQAQGILKQAGAPDINRDDATREQKLADLSKWYEQHYGSGESTAKTLGGGALEYAANLFGAGAAGAGFKGLAAAAPANFASGFGAGMRNQEDASGAALSGLASMGVGGAVHGLGQAANATPGAMRAAGGWLAQKGRDAKNAVVANAAAARSVAKEHGVESLTEMLGDLLTKYSPSGLGGMSAAAHGKNIAAQREVSGSNLDQLRGYFDEHALTPDIPSQGSLMPGVPGDMTRVQEALRSGLGSRVGSLSPYADSASRGERSAIGMIADDVPSFRGVTDVAAHKTRYQQSARPGDNGYDSVADSATKQADAAAGSILRGEEERLFAERAPESINQSFLGEKDRYSKLAVLDELLQKRATAEANAGGLGGIVTSSLAGGLAGAGAAAYAGENPIMGGAVGFGAGFGLSGGATRTAVRQMLGTRGEDIGANVLQSAGARMGRMGDVGLPASLGGLAAGNMTHSDQVSRGHESTSSIESALQQNPQQLRQYGPRLAEAKQRGELSEEISKLYDDEEEFRALMRDLGRRR